MDFITPGLRPRNSQSLSLINEINENSKILFRLKRRFKDVNKAANTFIVSQLANCTNEAPQFNLLEKKFEELYYLLKIDDFKFGKVSKVDIAEVRDLYASVPEDVSTSVNGTLTELINTYSILVAQQNLSNSLIYKTLLLKSNLVYWEELQSSKLNKIIYFVQTSPTNLINFFLQLRESFANVSYTETFGPGTEEDNFMYNIWVRVKAFAGFAKENVSKILVFNNPSLSFTTKQASSGYFQFLHNVYTFPLNYVNREIAARIKHIQSDIEALETLIDELLKVNVENNSECISVLQKILNVQDTHQENTNIRSILDKLTTFSNLPDSRSEQPSFVVRYWPFLLLLVRYGPSHSYNLYTNREEIVQWIKHNLVDTVVGFFKNWLIKPVADMLSVLRQDDEITITSKESLKSDVSSLERMLFEFSKDENINLDQLQVHDLVQNGDLTMLMSKYESEIRSPIKSLLRGSLIRSILIQVQKGKVDGGLAVSGIDKILKSQQLVFGFVSLSPALFIVYKIWGVLTTSKPLMINGKLADMLCLRSLNNIENLLILLNSGNVQSNYEGKLLIEIINLIITSKTLIPKQLREDWIRDLNELNNVDYDVQTKLNLIRKVWNMYSHYFR